MSDTTTFNTLELQAEGPVARIWLNRPELRNAFDEDYSVRGFYFQNEPPDWPVELYRQKGDPRQLGLTASLQF